MNYIDLFAGAGGLSEGFKKAGFIPVAHVEADGNACLTLKTRLAYHYLHERNQLGVYHDYLRRQNGSRKVNRFPLYNHIDEAVLNSVIHHEIADNTLEEIFYRIDKCRQDEHIQLIVGGPPCQAYSIMGRARMGRLNVIKDKRYTLYKQYVRFLDRYQPEFFVFENVLGILSAERGKLFNEIRRYFLAHGYFTEYRILNASDYGVLQNRVRVIIIGKRGTEPFEFPMPDPVELGTDRAVRQALFSDLEPLAPGEQKFVSNYTGQPATNYLFRFNLRNGADFVSQHITRPHIERDLEIYRIAISKLLNDGERLRYKMLPEELITHQNTEDFGDRFKVINPNGLSHTVVAHLHKDGHHYIYPDLNQVRSISVREAARIQSFSDDYFFEGGRTAAYKQIGNAVPPLLAEKIAIRLRDMYFPDTPVMAREQELTNL